MREEGYRTIVVDPPWTYNAAKGLPTSSYKSSTAEAHYQTMSNAEIAALPVSEWAAAAAHCYLWVTVPRLFGERHDRKIAPIDILEGWGFTWKTMLTWVKTGPLGMGWYFRGEVEHVLFGVRGDLGVPAAQRRSNVITSPRRRHSAKPEAFYSLVEAVSPGPRLDVFARKLRPGWDAYGDEIDPQQVLEIVDD